MHFFKLTRSWAENQQIDGKGHKHEFTHGSQELLVEFKGHERAWQVTEPLFEHTGNDVDIVVIQIHAADI